MVPDLVVVAGWYRVLPFLAAVLIAVACTAFVTPKPAISARSLLAAGVALAGWVVVATQATKLVDGPLELELGAASAPPVVSTEIGALLLVGLVALLALAVAGLLRSPESTPAFTGRATPRRR
jgi:hypothetical protein